MAAGSYPVVVGIGGGQDVNGGNSTFNSNLVIANGGIAGSGTTAGAGGAATTGTGYTSFAGGNGAATGGSSGGGGGGSARTTAAGSAASGITGGTGTGNGGNSGASGINGGNGAAPGGGGAGHGNNAPTSGTGGVGRVVVTVQTALSVLFGDITAIIHGNALTVDFTTISEKNNSHFEIEGSSDGVNFKKIGQLESQHKDGNADSPTKYSITIDKNNSAGLLAVSLAAVVFVIGLFNRKNKFLLSSFLIVGSILFFTASCGKQNNEIENTDSNIFIRVKQVDIDNTVSYSKVVKVIAQ